MYQIQHTVIAGDTDSGIDQYLEAITKDQQNLVSIEADGKPVTRLITDISVEILKANTKYDSDQAKTLAITGLDYGDYSTRDLMNLIRAILRTVNTANTNHYDNQDKPLINHIIWIGTRRTLISLLSEEITYLTSQPNSDYQEATLKSITKEEAASIKPYLTEPDKPFFVNNIKVTINNERPHIKQL